MEAVIKYMVIDYSSVDKTALLKVAPLREAQLWGQLYEAEGRMVMAPLLAIKSFTKFDGGTIQYLYWNVTQKAPPEDYRQLIQDCYAAIDALAVDPTPVEVLEARVKALGLDREEPVKKERQVGAPSVQPKGTTTTGRVWLIATGMVVGNVLPDRKAVIAACEAEGINPSTASTQYGKWRNTQVSKKG